MKALFIIPLLFFVCISTSLTAYESKPFNNPYPIASYQDELTYQEWFDGLALCFRDRPDRDYLAKRLISKYPEYSNEYVGILIKATAGAALIDLISSLANKDSSKATDYYSKMSPFFDWYFDLARQALEDEQFSQLERAVGY